MKNKLSFIKKHGIFAIFLPFMAGCGGGGVGFLGSLFGASGTLLASLSGGGAGLSASTLGSSSATITNPEPATMLLMGSGMAAMAYFKSKSSHK